MSNPGFKVVWDSKDGPGARYQTEYFTDADNAKENHEAAREFARKLESEGHTIMRVSPTEHWYTK